MNAKAPVRLWAGAYLNTGKRKGNEYGTSYKLH
nr:MAG TPA: hypothetical protein [Caudoviricetes sp.]